MNFRVFVLVLACSLVLVPPAFSAGVAKLEFDSGANATARILRLSWDTEATALPGRTSKNLLGSGISEGSVYLTATVAGTQYQGKAQTPSALSASSATFTVNPQGLAFTLGGQVQGNGLALTVSVSGNGFTNLSALDLVFEFNPLVTPTTVIPSAWVDSASAESYFNLPAIINAPDWGQMLFTSPTVVGMKGFLNGTRPNGDTATSTPAYANYNGQVVMRISIPPPTSPTSIAFSLTPSSLSEPQGVDSASWVKARRGWYGAWQPNANFTGNFSYFLQSRPAILSAGSVGTWQTQAGREKYNAVGILGNNVVSDIGSGSLWFYADQAYFTPQLAPGISIASSIKRSIEWWLDNRTFKTAGNDLGNNFQSTGIARAIPTIDAPGQVIYYWDYSDFLDAEASLVIAAWDYVDSTGDVAWLDGLGSSYWGTTTRLEQLELVAGYLAGRINASKMVAAFQDGTKLQNPDRGCSWFDTVASGNEDAFINALSYRAFRCLADLEFKKGNRNSKIRQFTTYADRLKDNYEARLLVTPQMVASIDRPTIAWWKDRGSPVSAWHGFHSPFINGIAIEYGLTSDANAGGLLNGYNAPNTGLWNKITQAGFTIGSQLGLPFGLHGWQASEYLDYFSPVLDHPFQTYQNGAVFAGHTLHPIVADRLVNGGSGNGNTVFQAMLDSQATSSLEPGFHNGTQYSKLAGKDFKKWNGDAAGYEGFLAEDFVFLQALPLSTPYWRSRFYRPLHPMQTQNDFDYDLRGDIIWYNSSAASCVVWYMNGPTFNSWSLSPVPGPGWEVEGMGDFNRDRIGDVLWRDTAGNTAIWFMTASGYSSSSAPQISTSQLIRGVTDFGNDGKADILLHNPTTGVVHIWHMDGAMPVRDQLLPLSRTNPWKLVGTGDLDDDGRPDLVWRNLSTGANEVWFHSLGTYPAAQALTTASTSWQLIRINDFDGDGKADLVWRNTVTGENQIWLMNGATVTTYALLPTVPPNEWYIVGASDFDGDRRADLLWRDTSGNNVIWFMNGGTLLHYDWIQPMSNAWQPKLPQN